MQDLDHSGAIHSKSYQQQVSSPSLSGPPSVDKVSPLGDLVPDTDEEIHNFIAKRLAYFRAILNKENRNDNNYGHALSCSSQNKPVWVENVDAIAKKDNASKTILQQYWNRTIDNLQLFTSTECPEMTVNVAATCPKHGDESPVVVTAVSETASGELTEKQSSQVSLNCSSPEGHKSPLFNINSKSMDDVNKVPERKNIATSVKPIEAVGLDSVKGTTDVSEDLKTTSSPVVSENELLELASSHPRIKNQDTNRKKKEQQCSITCKEGIARSNVSKPTNQSKWLCSQTSHGGAREDVACVCAQTHLSIALSENKVKEQAAPSESNGKEGRSVIVLKEPQHEDISDEENGPEPNKKLSPVENEGYGHVQSQAKMETRINLEGEPIPKTESEKLDCICRCFVETDDRFEGAMCPKCVAKTHQGWKTNHTLPCSSSFISDDEDEIDDQAEDGWIVIPISMSGLTFEPQDEGRDGSEDIAPDGGETGDKEERCVPAFASSQIEVFDTVDSFLQAKAARCTNKSPERQLDSEKEPHTPQDRMTFYSEHEDSCETEDSCDYSSGSEHNYLTVSRRFLKKRSAPPPLETDDSLSEKEDERKLQRLINICVCNGHVHRGTTECNISKNDIIILDSDTDDESDQNCKEKAKRRRLFSTGLEDPKDPQCSQQRRCSPVQESKKRRLAADSPAPQRQSKLKDTRFKDDLSHSTEKRGQLIGTGAGAEQQKTDRQQISTDAGVIIIDSDTEDDQSYKRADGEQDACSDPSQSTKGAEPMIERETDGPTSEGRRTVPCDSNEVVKCRVSQRIANTKRVQSSAAEDSDNARFATKTRPSTETVDRLCETAKKKHKRATQSSDNSTTKQPRSVDKKADSPLGTYVIPHIRRTPVQESSQTNRCLKVVKKDSKVLTEGKDETPKTLTETMEKADSSEVNSWHLDRNEEGRSTDRHSAAKSKAPANAAKPRQVSRQFSLHSDEGPSGSRGSLSSASRRLSEARQSSASTTLLKSKQSTSVPRQHTSTSKLRRSLSYHGRSSVDHLGTPTKGPSPPAAMQSSAKMRVQRDWTGRYHSIKRDPKVSARTDEARRTRNSDSSREARRRRPSLSDKPPSQRHSCHKPATRLMKQTMLDYKQWTNARRRNAPREQRSSVGEGYKWSEKPTVEMPSKGSRRKGRK